MAIGTSGYMESIHFKQAPIAPNEDMYLYRNIGALANLTSSLVGAYQKVQTAQQAETVSQLKTSYSNASAAVNSSALSDVQKAEQIKQINLSFEAKLQQDGIQFAVASPLRDIMGKQELLNNNVVAKQNTETLYRQQAEGAATVYNANKDLGELNNIVNTSGLDPRELKTRIMNSIVSQSELALKDEAAKGGGLNTFNIRKQELVDKVDALRNDPKWLGDKSTYGAENVLALENRITTSISQSEKLLGDNTAKEVLSIFNNSGSEGIDFKVLQDKVDTLSSLGHSSAKTFQKKVDNLKTTLVAKQNNYFEPTVPVSPEVQTLVNNSPNASELKKTRNTAQVIGIGEALTPQSVDGTYLPPNTEEARNIINAATSSDLKSIRESNSARIDSAKTIEEVGSHISNVQKLGLNAASKIYKPEDIAKSTEVMLLNDYYGGNLDINQLKEKIAGATELEKKVWGGNLKQDFNDNVVSLANEIGNPSMRAYALGAAKKVTVLTGDSGQGAKVIEEFLNNKSETSGFETFNYMNSEAGDPIVVDSMMKRYAQERGVKYKDLKENSYIEILPSGDYLIYERNGDTQYVNGIIDNREAINFVKEDADKAAMLKSMNVDAPFTDSTVMQAIENFREEGLMFLPNAAGRAVTDFNNQLGKNIIDLVSLPVDVFRDEPNNTVINAVNDLGGKALDFFISDAGTNADVPDLPNRFEVASEAVKTSEAFYKNSTVKPVYQVTEITAASTTDKVMEGISKAKELLGGYFSDVISSNVSSMLGEEGLPLPNSKPLSSGELSNLGRNAMNFAPNDISMQDAEFLELQSDPASYISTDKIKTMQKYINSKGYDIDVDGIMGEQTRQGIMKAMRDVYQPKAAANVASSGVDSFVTTLGNLEGTADHVDTVGIKTKAYGLVYDTKMNPAAAKANANAAKELGYDLVNATPEQSKEIAALVTQKMDSALSKELPNYSSLSPKAKALVLDGKYNTGETFKLLTNALEKYEADPSIENLKQVAIQSRRKEKGNYTTGMDNRVGRLMYLLGYVENPNDIKNLGLDKVDISDGEISALNKKKNSM